MQINYFSSCVSSPNKQTKSTGTAINIGNWEFLDITKICTTRFWTVSVLISPTKAGRRKLECDSIAFAVSRIEIIEAIESIRFPKIFKNSVRYCENRQLPDSVCAVGSIDCLRVHSAYLFISFNSPFNGFTFYPKSDGIAFRLTFK